VSTRAGLNNVAVGIGGSAGRNIILMGSPGVGKGTQSRHLATRFGIPIVASGDMFRAVRQEHTALAEEVRRHMDRGEYVPDDLTIAMVLRRLSEDDTQRGFILDGFPRTVVQAEALDSSFREHGRHIDHVVLLKAPMETVLERLTGRRICSECGAVYNTVSNPPRVEGICDICGGKLYQRSDEAPEVQRHRLQVYERQTKPVLDYYKRDGRLEIVDATLPVDEVTTHLVNLVVGASEAR